MKRSLIIMSFVACSAFAQATAAKGPPPPMKKGPVFTVTKDINTPESVLYDEKTDTFLISNIGGQPLDKDNNGYISEISADGAPINMKFIEGGKNGVTLNAPKGSAIVNGVFYVCDIDTVRMFDRTTGAPKGEVKMPGAKFAGDLAAGPDGTVYVSDIGVDAKFQPIGTDAIWVIDTAAKKPTAKVLIKSKDLHGPNGLVVTADAVHYVTFGAPEIGTVDLKTKKIVGTPTKLPHGGLDGFAMIGDELLVSSWEAKAVYRGKLGGEFVEAVSDVESPADFGVDTKRNRVVIPRFMASAIEAWALK